MKSLQVLATGLLLFVVPAIRADEPKLPTTNPSPPTTALAQAVAEGDNVLVKFRLPKIVWVEKAVTKTIPEVEKVQKVIDGKEVVEEIKVEVPISVTIIVADEKASTWREEKVNLADRGVSITDTKGKPIAVERVAKLLEKETPVLVCVNGKPDSFHLLTVKEDTLILLVPPQVLYPPPPPPPAPPKSPGA